MQASARSLVARMEELLKCVLTGSDVVGTLQMPGRTRWSEGICGRASKPWKTVRANGYALNAQRGDTYTAVINSLSCSNGCVSCCWRNVPQCAA